MKKIITLILILVSSSLNAQFKPITLGVGIGNQYGIYGGARLALALSAKIEPSISFGIQPAGTETTIGMTYYFKGYGNIMSFRDKVFDWPSGISLGGNYYHIVDKGPFVEVTNPANSPKYGVTMLFFYKIAPRRIFGYTNTPLYERRCGFGATYFIGHPVEKIFVIPSLMFGADFRLPIKFKGFLL